MSKQMCQSCGMPINKDKMKGTEADGTLSQKYCTYCYQKGAFTEPNITVDEMKAKSKAMIKAMHFPGFIAEMMSNGVPKLERWKQ